MHDRNASDTDLPDYARCVTWPASRANDTSVSYPGNATLTFVVLTSVATWRSRSTEVLRTWGSLVCAPHSLWFSSDYRPALDDQEAGLEAAGGFHLRVSHLPGTGNANSRSKDAAQSRFVATLLDLPTPASSWVVLVDDDTWVYPDRMVAYASKRDPARVAFYGQIRCPSPTHPVPFFRAHGSFFGGAGGLYSPALMQRLKALGVQPEYRQGVTYEEQLAPVITGRAGGALVYAAGFHSQPPQHYTRLVCANCGERYGGGLPLTWHYVDEAHQRRDVRYRHSGCGGERGNCPALYDRLYADAIGTRPMRYGSRDLSRR